MRWAIVPAAQDIFTYDREVAWSCVRPLLMAARAGYRLSKSIACDYTVMPEYLSGRVRRSLQPLQSSCINLQMSIHSRLQADFLCYYPIRSMTGDSHGYSHFLLVSPNTIERNTGYDVGRHTVDK